MSNTTSETTTPTIELSSDSPATLATAPMPVVTEPPPPAHAENSTDATRGEPLAVRAQKRKLELEQLLAKVPADDVRARKDIELAVASFESLLTGDVEHLSESTAAGLSRLLEGSKHLAETAPVPAPRP